MKPQRKSFGQKLHLQGYYRRFRWKQGGRQEAMSMAVAGTTVPLAQYSFTASKDGQNYTGVVVGTSPFSQPLTGSTINAVVVPLKVGYVGVTGIRYRGIECGWRTERAAALP